MKHSQIRKFLRRSCSLLLTGALCMPPAVFASQGEPRIQTSHELLDGLTYINTVSEHTAGRTESFVLELAEDSKVFPILLQSSGTIYGTATINAAVKQAQALGYQVLAAVNTDYFSTATGVPMGIVIEDGVYKSDAAGNPAMVIVDGEVLLCEKPEVSLSLTNEENDIEIVPNYFNKYRASTGGVYLLNEYFSTVSTRTNSSGWFVRMEVVDYDPDDLDHQLTVNSELELEVTEVLQTNGAITIGEGEYILTADDVSNKLSVFESFQVGDRVTLETACEDGDLSDAQWAGGVGDTIVDKNKTTDPSGWTKVDYVDSVRAPRTALGVRTDGTLLLYTVDGRQSRHSVGLTMTDLANEMVKQDCKWAVNLDGGGSTSTSVWLPGQTAPAIQNSPSDGKARSCATYLLLVTDKEGNGRPERLALTENGLLVLTGSSLVLPEAIVLDSGLNILDEELDDLTITSRTGLGEIEDGIYTAGANKGTDQLRLRSRDLDITGEADIHVVEELSELTITADGKAVSSLKIKPNQTVQLGASGTYWGRTALRGLEGVEITLAESVGSLDENGRLTFASTARSGDTITFSAGGLNKTLPLTVTNVHTDVGEDHWGYKAVEYCYANNIVSGISSTEFGATGLIRRADFMLMLYAAMGRPTVSTPCTFTDVSERDYYYTALAWAQSKGLISGGGDGTCAATASITREQAFTILRRALPLLGKNCPDAPLSALASFADKDTISDYAKPHTATLVAQGVVSGSGSGINPKGNLTRVEMAALLYKISTYTPVTEYPDLEPDPVVPEVPETPETPESPEAPEDEQPALPFPQFPAGTVTGTVTDAEAGLNVRSGPGTEHEALTKLKNGASVIITQQPEGWYQVLYRSEDGSIASGYVSADYVTVNSLPGTVTDAEAGLNVRSGPGTDHAVQAKLANGCAVIVAEQLDGWHRIWYLNEKSQMTAGYVSADYIALPE